MLVAPGIVGNICEPSHMHPVHASGSNSMPSMALPFNNYCREWVHRKQKVLVQMNIQLTEVLSNVMGTYKRIDHLSHCGGDRLEAGGFNHLMEIKRAQRSIINLHNYHTFLMCCVKINYDTAGYEVLMRQLAS